MTWCIIWCVGGRGVLISLLRYQPHSFNYNLHYNGSFKFLSENGTFLKSEEPRGHMQPQKQLKYNLFDINTCELSFLHSLSGFSQWYERRNEVDISIMSVYKLSSLKNKAPLYLLQATACQGSQGVLHGFGLFPS